MSDPREWPGDPTPGQIATADQRHRAIQEALDDLITSARGVLDPGERPDTRTWVRVAAEDVTATVSDFAKAPTTAVLIGLLAEAVVRLAYVPEDRSEAAGS